MRHSLLLSLILGVAAPLWAAPSPVADLAVPVDGPYDVTFSLAKGGANQQLLLDWDGGQGLVVTFGAKATVVETSSAKGRSPLASGPACPAGPVRIQRRFPALNIGAVRTFSRRPLAGVAAPATGSSLGDFTVQPVEPVEFSDEFFDPSGGESVWTPVSGKWSVFSYRDPLKALENRPIAAAWYQCEVAGAPAFSVTGEDFWNDYRASVKVRVVEGVTVGLVTDYRGPNSYRLVKLQPLAGGQALLSRLTVGGGASAPEETKMAVRPGNWVLLSTPRASGKCGVYADGKGEARFDDFTAQAVPDVTDSFQRPMLGECWRASAGKWHLGPKGGRLTSATTGLLLRELDYTPEYATAHGDGAWGVALNWTGNSGYQLVASGKGCKLLRVDAGKPTVLFSEPVASPPWRLSHHDGRLVVGWAEGARVAYDFTYSDGACGLVAQGKASFTAFSAGPVNDTPTAISSVTGVPMPMPGENADTNRFLLGFVWQPAGGYWTGTGPQDDKLLSVRSYSQQPTGLWYFQPCPGDAVLALSELKVPDGARAGVALGCSRREVTTGYRAEVQGLSLKLFRADQQVAETKLTQPATDLRAWRDGAFIVARAGTAGLAFSDSQPLSGALCAAYAGGNGVTMRQVDLANRQASYYAFHGEETDWQPVSGDWSTHSGMACIAWDYWYTSRGTPDALAFNARPALSLQHVDGWVAEYTEGYADGEHKHFPYHDISLVMNAQKPELDGGYRFVIGADGGGVTRLLRLGKVVAETRDHAFQIRMNSHCNTPRDIHFLVHREGGRLTLTLNDRPALDWTDPQPLGPGQLGIGTTGCSALFRDLWTVSQ